MATTVDDRSVGRSVGRNSNPDNGFKRADLSINERRRVASDRRGAAQRGVAVPRSCQSTFATTTTIDLQPSGNTLLVLSRRNLYSECFHLDRRSLTIELYSDSLGNAPRPPTANVATFRKVITEEVRITLP